MTERMRWLDSSHIIWFVGKIYLLLQVKKLKKTLRIGERRGKCICKDIKVSKYGTETTMFIKPEDWELRGKWKDIRPKNPYERLYKL